MDRADTAFNALDAADVVAATTREGRKVHLAWGNRTVLCDMSERATGLVAVFPGDGLEGTVAGLAEAGVRKSRLCKHCFTVATRKAYSDYLASKS